METVLSPVLAVARSSFPSPLKSPTAVPRGPLPVGKLFCAKPTPWPRTLPGKATSAARIKLKVILVLIALSLAGFQDFWTETPRISADPAPGRKSNQSRGGHACAISISRGNTLGPKDLLREVGGVGRRSLPPIQGVLGDGVLTGVLTGG